MSNTENHYQILNMKIKQKPLYSPYTKQHSKAPHNSQKAGIVALFPPSVCWDNSMTSKNRVIGFAV